ncbi:MAG: ClC family H(+)/Cl(-) exchange transporter [Lactobacillus sp.]|nr:ClC family H(+)/Cl(-) exchange transporter [Lactobacillus sp.]MCI1481186.1 ClC family H(+)/Cl(-) exchange transporter [Lactobacillus sp.]
MKKKQFASLGLTVQALIVGAITGVVVSLFRWLIMLSQRGYRKLIMRSHQQLWWLLVVLVLLVTAGVLAGLLVKQEPHVSGSGIPEVELQLQGKLQLHWWPILRNKFIGGVLSIGSGLFLGREGPSIQLGASIGDGVGQLFKDSQTNRRLMLASGAASGLAAAFNAPLGGTMFILEEVFHNFSPRVWINALAGALMANFVTSNLFGLKPVLNLPEVRSFPLHLYWHLLILGVLLGVLSWVYQWALLHGTLIYEKIKFLPRWLDGILPMILLVPIAYFAPNDLGGGNNLIVGWQNKDTLWLLAALFLLRFVFSIFSYDSGLPGGIFLPILTLGAIVGALYGMAMWKLGLLPQNLIVNLIIFAMTGYFAGIVRSPFTGILLLAEMVGSLFFLMPLAVVALVAFLVDDLLGGKPIYESLAANQHPQDQGCLTGQADQLTVTVYANSKFVGKTVSQINWPDRTLLKLIQRGSEKIIPHGSTPLQAGDLLVLELDSGQRAQVFDALRHLQGS